MPVRLWTKVKDFLLDILQEFAGWFIFVLIIAGILVCFNIVPVIRDKWHERNQTRIAAEGVARFREGFTGGKGTGQADDGELRFSDYSLFLPKGFMYYGIPFKPGRYLVPFFTATSETAGIALDIWGSRWDGRNSVRGSGLILNLPKEVRGWRQYRQEVYFEDPRRPEAVFYRGAGGERDIVQAFLQDGETFVVFIFRLEGPCGIEHEAFIKRILFSFRLNDT